MEEFHEGTTDVEVELARDFDIVPNQPLAHVILRSQTASSSYKSDLVSGSQKNILDSFPHVSPLQLSVSQPTCLSHPSLSLEI